MQLEVHLFDFQHDIYGRHVQVDFLAFLRPSNASTPWTRYNARSRQIAGRRAPFSPTRHVDLAEFPALYTL